MKERKRRGVSSSSNLACSAAGQLLFNHQGPYKAERRELNPQNLLKKNVFYLVPELTRDGVCSTNQCVCIEMADG